MKSMMTGAAFAVALSLAAPAAAHPQDAAINAVYDAITAAKAGNDADGIAAAFAPDALIVDARPGAAVSGAELGARLAPMVARMRADSARVATQYRIERRQVSGDVAVDAGYMRQTIERADGVAGPPPMVTKFLVTLRQTGGRWRIVADASMPASEAAWAGAVRGAGLKFDG